MFHDIRLSDEIEKGTQGGLGFYTTIQASPGGPEQRNQMWEDDRGEWDISFGMRKKIHIDFVKSFWLARRGSAHSFRFKDWTDYQAALTFVANGDGVVGGGGVRTGTRDFQLVKTYIDAVNPYLRPIYKPVAATLQVFINNVIRPHTLLDHGIIRITDNAHLPLVGEVVTASYDFDVPVRFASDRLIQQIAQAQTYGLPAIKIVGVVPPDY